MTKKIFTFLSMVVLICACKPDSSSKVVESTGDDVLDELNTLISKDTLNHGLLFNRAGYYYDQENYDAAIVDLKKAIELEPKKFQYYHLLSDTYMDYFRSKDALMIMNECVSVNSESVPSLLKLSETQLILKQYDESLMTVNKILTLNDQNAEAFFMMGMNFKAMENRDKALGAFQTAIELNPDLLDGWLIIGDMLSAEKNPLAVDYYNSAIEVEPKNPLTYHSKAYHLQNSGKISEAIALYKQINLVDKNYVDAYLNAGILYFTQDSFPQAFEQFDIMTKVKPQNFMGYYYRGITNNALNKIEAAKSDLNNCLNLNPEFVKAQEALEQIQG